MAITNDYEFTALVRLVDSSEDVGSGELWVRVRAIELIKSMEPSRLSASTREAMVSLPGGRDAIHRESYS
jgi:hypothetical protein